MKTPWLLALGLVACLSSSSLFASSEGAHAAQNDYEKSIDSVVRHKHFYKAGKFELGAVAGVMPYDSLVNHYMVGARATWHITDHFGWEIADAQKTFPSITSYATNDVVSAKGITNLQTVQINWMAATNLLISPLYGKIHFFGRQVLYYDIYMVVGGGMANTNVVQLSAATAGAAVTQTTLKTGMDPMADFGFGFKIFTGDAMALLIDMRDYVVNSHVYNSNSFKSNFSVFLGMSFFVPFFG